MKEIERWGEFNEWLKGKDVNNLSLHFDECKCRVGVESGCLLNRAGTDG